MLKKGKISHHIKYKGDEKNISTFCASVYVRFYCEFNSKNGENEYEYKKNHAKISLYDIKTK